MLPHRLRNVLLTLPLLLSPLVAQTAHSDLPGQLRRACGLQTLDGSLWAGGPAYKAEFRADAVEYTPALGKLAPHNLPLSLSLAAVGRGEDLQPTGAVAPGHEGRRVQYQHGVCEVRYDVTPEGLEQSFVFAALPPGHGDLRIRLAVATELPLGTATDGGLRFELAGVGGVSLGAVTGIDARGERCPGAITCTAGVVELTLPAAFVQRAVLPLVVDPLIGTTFAVTNSLSDYQAPDIAASAGAAVTLSGSASLVVFEREISATDRDIRALNLTDSGSIDGSLLLVTTGTALDTAPAVGAVFVHAYYVVVYERGGYLMARPVSMPVFTLPSTVGAEVTVVATADTMGAPDVGGELTNVDNEVVCVYRNLTQDRIQAQQISCTSTGALTAFAPVTLATAPVNSTFGRPRIAHDGGVYGYYLVVYPRTPLLGGTQLNGIVVDRNLGVLASAALTASSADDHDNPDVDGNGIDWVVAFDQESATTVSDTNVRALPVAYSAFTGQLVVGASVGVSSIAGVDEFEPAVAFLTSTCLVAWRRAAAASTDSNVYCKTVDLYTCALCETAQALATTTASERNLAIAHLRSPGGQGVALVLWETSDATGNGDIDGLRFDPNDGRPVSFAPTPDGGCGEGGFVSASCARVGNVDFRVRLRLALPTSTAWLVMSSWPTQIGCGPCSLRADPWNGFLFPGIATDAHGDAQQLIPIPNAPWLLDMPLVAQWIVGPATGLCPALNTDFSTALNFRLQ